VLVKSIKTGDTKKMLPKGKHLIFTSAFQVGGKLTGWFFYIAMEMLDHRRGNRRDLLIGLLK